MATQDLRIRIGLDESGKIQAQLAGVSSGFRAFDRDVKTTSTGLKGLVSGVGLLGSVLPTLGAGAAVAGLTSLATRALDTAGALQDAADRTGFGVEALQEYGFAAEQVGVSQGALEQSLGAFTRNVGKAREGTGTLSAALRENNEELLIGVASAGSMEQALDLVLEAIDRESDAAGKAALATAAFGRSGQQLLPILTSGVAGLDDMRQRARELGLVLSADLVAGGDAAGDRLGELGSLIRGNLNRALLEAAPLIEDTATALTDLGVAGFSAFSKLNAEIANTRRIMANTIELETEYGSVDAAAERLVNLRRELETLEARPRKDLDTGEAQRLRDLQVEAQRLGELLGLVPPAVAAIGDASKKALGGMADEDIPGVQRGLTGLRLDSEKLGGTLDGIPTKLDPLIVAIGDVKPLEVIDNEIFAQQIGEAVKLVKGFSNGIPKVKVEIDEAFVRENAGKIRDFIEKFPDSIPRETRQVLIELLADDTGIKASLQSLRGEISAFTRDVEAGAVGAVEAVDAALAAMQDQFDATNAAAERLILFGGRGIRNQVNEVTGLGKSGAFSFPDAGQTREEFEGLVAANDIEGLREFTSRLKEIVSTFRDTTDFNNPFGRFVIEQQSALSSIAEEAARRLPPIVSASPHDDLRAPYSVAPASRSFVVEAPQFHPYYVVEHGNQATFSSPTRQAAEAYADRVGGEVKLSPESTRGTNDRLDRLIRAVEQGTSESRRMRESITRGDVAVGIASQVESSYLVGTGRRGWNS